MNLADEQDGTDTAEHLSPDWSGLRFYEFEPRTRARAEVAGRSHPGRVRLNNEDNFLAVRRYRGRELLLSSVPREALDPAEDHAYTLAVADGMGGRNFGELASLLALRLGWELGGGEVKWTMKLNEREVEELRQKAKAFFGMLDEAIHAEVRESPRLAGMGTTLTIGYSTGPELFVLHAGDSRAYLHRGGTPQRLTRDHNLAQVLIDAGATVPGSREARRLRHVLTNVLGGPDSGVHVDVGHHRLHDGDRVLLCTDGLTDGVSDEEIGAVLDRFPAVDDACNALIDLALERGGADNITVVLARYTINEEASGGCDARSLLGG